MQQELDLSPIIERLERLEETRESPEGGNGGRPISIERDERGLVSTIDGRPVTRDARGLINGVS